MSETKDYIIKNKEEKNSELTLDLEIESQFIDSFKEKAIKNLGKDIEIKGFRKGMAPADKVVEKIGDMKILEEQAVLSINEVLPVITLNEKIEAITHPKIAITKLAQGNNLELKATFILMPKVELADYKKIAKEVPVSKDAEVTEKEIEDYIEYIRKNRAEADYMQKKTSGEEVDEKEKDNLPEFNDKFVKTLGEFKNVEEFKKELLGNMKKDKTTKEQQNRRVKIIEKIIAESKIEIPEILVQEEQERMLRQFKFDIENMKVTFEDYLKELKKTEEDLKTEWKADAEKRSKMNMILPKIAVEEKIKIDEEKLNKEIEHLRSHNKDVNEYQAKVYLANAMTNEKVFEFLENLK